MEPNTEFTKENQETKVEKSTAVNMVTIPPMEVVSIPDDKIPGWIRLGDSFYSIEKGLKEMVEEALSEYCLPMTIDDIPEAEKQLKKITSTRVKIEETRKKFTSRLDDLSTRMMLPEKSLNEPKQNLTDAIIKIKKAYEEEAGKVAKRNEEIKRLNEAMIKHTAEQEEKIQLFISNLLSKAYTFAIDKKIVPAEVQEYVKVCIHGGTNPHFGTKTMGGGIKSIMDWKQEPYGHYAVNITNKEASDIMSKYYVDVVKYANEFEYEMNKKFSDYTVAFANAKDALLKDARDRAEKEAQLAKDKLNTQISASIQAAAVPVEATLAPETKALKKVYKIEMSDTFESMISIIAAFLANKDECLKKTTAKKWMAFTAASAALCLEKIKNEQPAFQPAGIKFVETDKL